MYVVQKVLVTLFHSISSDIVVQINKLEMGAFTTTKYGAHRLDRTTARYRIDTLRQCLCNVQKGRRHHILHHILPGLPPPRPTVETPRDLHGAFSSVVTERCARPLDPVHQTDQVIHPAFLLRISLRIPASNEICRIEQTRGDL
jgi:hypothetical protein